MNFWVQKRVLVSFFSAQQLLASQKGLGYMQGGSMMHPTHE
jgi:hypothetical protein